MNRSSILLIVFLLISTAGCDTYVENVDQPINSIDDSQLNDESQVGFIIKGVQSRFSTTYDRIAVFAGGISDEFIFDQNVPNASFQPFLQMDLADISFANIENDALYHDLGELRFFADKLGERIDAISFEDAELQQEAMFIAEFYGGVARYFYAAYYGLNKREGGGVITEDPTNPGPFIPSAQMFELALSKLNSAKNFADDYQTRVINTLIARIYLIQGNYAEARIAASAGMINGDDAFNSLHDADNTNYFFKQAGIARTQWVTDFRYNDYVTANPDEATRIPLMPILGIDESTTYYMQNLYPERESPLPFATWQENELMLAELDIRENNAPNALTRLNAVRASHNLSALPEATMDALIIERDKELFTMGLRLLDQRRMDLWHLGDDTWWYLPITQSERNINSNF